MNDDNGAWPTSFEPGGMVPTDYGPIPGCLNKTCAHAQLAHDVEYETDQTPRCGAPGCPCGHPRRRETRRSARPVGDGMDELMPLPED